MLIRYVVSWVKRNHLHNEIKAKQEKCFEYFQWRMPKNDKNKWIEPCYDTAICSAWWCTENLPFTVTQVTGDLFPHVWWSINKLPRMVLVMVATVKSVLFSSRPPLVSVPVNTMYWTWKQLSVLLEMKETVWLVHCNRSLYRDFNCVFWWDGVSMESWEA